MKRSRTLIFTILGFLLIFGGGLGLYAGVNSARNLVPVMVAKADIAPYTTITDADVEAIEVPQASVTEQDITKDEYEKSYRSKGDRTMVATMHVLSGDKFDERVIAKDAVKSFAAVSGDERVIASTSTVQGAAVGTIQAGDVVDVSTDSSGGDSAASVSYAKVLCISTSVTGCKGVLPLGQDLSTDQGGQDPAGGAPGIGSTEAGSVNILLAVPLGDAPVIAGRQVTLSLNPFCQFNAEGQFESRRKDRKCTPPAEREAAGGTGVADPSATDTQTAPDADATETAPDADATETAPDADATDTTTEEAGE